MCFEISMYPGTAAGAEDPEVRHALPVVVLLLCMLDDFTHDRQETIDVFCILYAHNMTRYSCKRKSREEHGW